MLLSSADLAARMQQIPKWSAGAGKKLVREFHFPDFAAALAFVNRVGQVAEALQHHPDVYLTWGRVQLELWTHSAGGITESDIRLAAECDRVG